MPERPIQGDVLALHRQSCSPFEWYGRQASMNKVHQITCLTCPIRGHYTTCGTYGTSLEAYTCIWYWYTQKFAGIDSLIDDCQSVFILRSEDMAGDATTIRRLMTVLTGLSIDTKSDFFRTLSMILSGEGLNTAQVCELIRMFSHIYSNHDVRWLVGRAHIL